MEREDENCRPVFPLADAFDSALTQCIKTRRPVIKGVYEPTGSGKTHSAVRFAIDAYLAPDSTIPIYIAPIKRLVEDFEGALADALEQRGLIDIPVYRLYARSDFAKDDSLLGEVISFCREARKVLIGNNLIDDPAILPQPDSSTDQQRKKRTSEQWINQVDTAVQQYWRWRDLAKINPLEAVLSEQMSDAMNRIWSGLSALCTEIIRCEVMSNYTSGYIERPALRLILLKLMPINLFIHKPGIIVATASKFVAQAREVQKRTSKIGVTKAITRTYDSFFEWASCRNERFCLFIDEEEEAYSYIFNAQKKKLTNRDVDLHRVVYAFFHHFDLGSLSNYADSEGDSFARKFFDSTSQIVNQLKDIKIVIESGGSIYEKIDGLKKITSLTAFSNAQLKLLVQDFFGKSDVQNDYKNLKQKLLILEKIKKFIIDVHKPWPKETNVEAPFDVYRRLQNVFQDKKQILAGPQVIKDLRTELEYLFFNEQLELVDHSVLEQVRVVPSIAHRNLELVTANELLQEAPAKQKASFSLGEFLRFIMMMTQTLFRTPITIQDADKFSRISDHQSEVLCLYRQKIGLWGIDSSGFPMGSVPADDPLLTEISVFHQSKFAMSIVEDVGRKTEYSTNLRIISMAATVLRKTPEDLLSIFLRTGKLEAEYDSRPGNIAYLMSATGGMKGCWSGFNLPYLSRQLALSGSELLGPTSHEMQFMQSFRSYRGAKRNIRVYDFDADPARLIEGLRPGELYIKLEKEFENDLQGEGRFENNPYKRDEIRYIAALISRLACGQERSAMAFTQTVETLKRILNRMAVRGMGVKSFNQTSGLYTFDPSVFGIKSDPIRIITYTASFGKDTLKLVDDRVRVLTEIDGTDEDDDQSVLSSLLDETNYKVLFVSSFRSAARGLNLTLKYACQNSSLESGQQSDRKKDFDILMLAMSPYYDGLYRSPDDAETLIERLQAMLQHLYLNNTLGMYHYRDLPQAIADGREEAFHPEYYRNIAREIIQAIGRAERVDGGLATQHIFLNREVIYELVQFYKMEPEFSNRLSVANHAVYLYTEALKQQTTLFQTEKEWGNYVKQEIIKADSFLAVSASLYRGFRSRVKRETWERIRNPLMFINPEDYLYSLEQTPAGMPDDRWKSFVSYAFQPRNRIELYLISVDKAVAAMPDADRMLGEDVMDAVGGRLAYLSLVTDLYHAGRQAYKPEQNLIPPALRHCPEFKAAVQKTGINLETLFIDWLPRPQFFIDYVKGYFAELIFTNLMLNRSWVKTIDVVNHPNVRDIYEKFDVFIEGPTQILAIDLKNWGRRTDRLVGRKLRQAASAKTKTVEAFLHIPINAQRTAIRRAKIVEQKLGPKTVVPIYLNLSGTRCSGQEILDDRIIPFFNLFVAEYDANGYVQYVLNQNFINLIDSIYKDGIHV